MTEPTVAIILLNWNAWRDTVQCVESLLRSTWKEFVVVVCDNGSDDDSWEQLQSWCATRHDVATTVWAPGAAWDASAQVVLIQNGANLGFAAGCNVGIRFALLETDSAFVWLLNNDTVVDSEALRQQVRCMQANPAIGLLGSTLVYFDHPETVQCFGGYGFNFWTGRVRPMNFPPDPNCPPAADEVERLLAYVSGASTLVRREFLDTVGLMNEQYFLYFEEIDWAVRGMAFRKGYCPESIVFHKEGRSIGSSRAATRRSEQSELWLTRNRILFTRTYYPLRAPVAAVWVLLVAAVRLCTGNRKLAAVLARGVWQGLKAPILPLPDAAVWPAATLQAATRRQPSEAMRYSESTAR